MSRRAYVLSLGVIVSALASPIASAQENYPAKPVRIIVPYSVGGAADVATRAYAQGLSELLGAQVYVDNKPGGGTNLAAGLAAHAPADGYTLYMANFASNAVNKYLYKELPYDPEKDFAAVSMLARGGMFLIINPALPVKSVQDVIRLAKQKPGTMSYASVGIGSPNHIVGELFKLQTKIDVTHVPYKGSAEANRDVVAGQVEFMFDANAMNLVHAGRLKALAIAYTERWPSEPDIPCMAELGYPGVSMLTFYALVAPANTPVAILDKLANATRTIAQRPEIAKILAVSRQLPFVATRSQAADFLREQGSKWAPVVKASGARVD